MGHPRGRPPIGKRRMTGTEYQRRWRQKRRRQQLTGPEPRPSTRTTLDEPDRQPASREAAERIADLTRQLGQALMQLEELAQRGVAPGAAGQDYPHPCFVCHQRLPEAKGMITAERPRFTLFLCNGCLHEMCQHSDRIIRG